MVVCQSKAFNYEELKLKNRDNGNKSTRDSLQTLYTIRSSIGGGFKGIFPSVNFFASNCFSSSADSSFFGVNNFSEAIVVWVTDDASAPLLPKAFVGCPNRVFLESKDGAATAELLTPNTGADVLFEELVGSECSNPENPDVPKPAEIAELLNEKDAADEAVWCPKPTEWVAVVEEDVALSVF